MNQVLRQELLQSRKQNFLAHWLRDVIREAFVHIEILGIHHRICGKHHHRSYGIRIFFQFLHLTEGFDTIHHRHHVIQENHIIMLFLYIPQRFRSVDSHIDLDFRFLEESRKDLQVHLHIVGNKDARIGRLEALMGLAHRLLVLLVQLRKITDRRFVADLLQKPNGKGGTLSIDTIHMDGAAHHVQQLSGQIQPEASSFDIAVPLFVKADKVLEQFPAVAFANSDTRILHLDAKHDLVRELFGHRAQIVLLGTHRQHHGTFVRVLNRIRQQIVNDLLNTHFITK